MDEAEAGVAGVAKAVPKAWFDTVASLRTVKNMPKEQVHSAMKKFVNEADAAGYTA
jgi:hypothetical protein